MVLNSHLAKLVLSVDWRISADSTSGSVTSDLALHSFLYLPNVQFLSITVYACSGSYGDRYGSFEDWGLLEKDIGNIAFLSSSRTVVLQTEAPCLAIWGGWLLLFEDGRCPKLDFAYIHLDRDLFNSVDPTYKLEAIWHLTTTEYI